MSGIEVVGLVLAVIPLFISAAEHYREGLNTIDKWRKKDRILQKYLEDLGCQQTYLIMGLESLLADVDLDYNVKAQLIGDTSSDLERFKPALSDVWEKPIVREKLVERFGEGYKPFIYLMQNLSKTLTSQVKKHDLLPSGAIDKSSASDCTKNLLSFHNNLKRDNLLDSWELWDRIKFTWDEPERNETLADIRRYNDELFKLFYRIQSAKAFNKEQRSHRAGSVFRVRDQAQRIHQVLSHHCRCRCIPYHQAKLCLRRLYCQSHPTEDTSFQTMLYQSPMCPCPATIRVMDNQIVPKVKAKVRINVESLQKPPDYQGTALDNICTAIQHARTKDVHMELVIDSESKLWEATISKSTTLGRAPMVITLESLLAAFSEYSRKRWLAKEKAILAVILSHSLLQLQGSEWLSKDWRSEHISFLRDRDVSPATARSFGLEKPYLSADINHFGDPRAIIRDENAPSRSHGHPIPSLLALGVILLELHQDASIETNNTASAEDLQTKSLKVLMSCSDEMEKAYYDVISFCLFLSPAPPTSERTFEDAKFRDHYYQQVIVPLEDILTENFEFSKKDLEKL